MCIYLIHVASLIAPPRRSTFTRTRRLCQLWTVIELELEDFADAAPRVGLCQFNLIFTADSVHASGLPGTDDVQSFEPRGTVPLSEAETKSATIVYFRSGKLEAEHLVTQWTQCCPLRYRARADKPHRVNVVHEATICLGNIRSPDTFSN